MDRPSPTAATFDAALEPEAAHGWDAHAVWQQRVRRPRLATSGVASMAALPPASSTGWDPLETWRLRVQHARRPSR